MEELMGAAMVLGIAWAVGVLYGLSLARAAGLEWRGSERAKRGAA